VAEGRGKAQADTLRNARKDTVAHRLTSNGTIETIPSTQLKAGDVMHLDNPHTAILSAVIYNAVIIPLLIPVALRGVKFKPRDG